MSAPTRLGTTMSTGVLRIARCAQRAWMPFYQAERPKHLIPSSVQPLATWSERFKRWSSGNQTEKEKSESKKQDKGTSVEETVKSSDSKSSKNEFAAVIEEKDQKIKELQDKYLRALAETENIRQRMKKQVEESKLYGIQEFSRDILGVADILQKATESVPKESLKDSSNHVIALYDGVKMTETNLQKVLQKHGIAQINPLGEVFDPVLHEAMFEVEGEKPGTIAHVSMLGYTLHGRTIRPAKVAVVKS